MMLDFFLKFFLYKILEKIFGKNLNVYLTFPYITNRLSHSNGINLVKIPIATIAQLARALAAKVKNPVFES